jgi:DNA-binding transcriptional LysR family regulator
MTDLNDMRYFAEVATRGSFAAAGRALDIPKSRLSRRIAQLESDLGVRLLQRTTRKLSLTRVGEEYLRHCMAIVEEARIADEVAARAQTLPRGVVRVTCPITLAQGVIGLVLPRFLLQFPQVQVDMEVTNRVVDVVQDGVDIALRVRPSLADSGSNVVKRLGLSQALLVAGPAQLARQGKVSGPDDLATLDTVAMSAYDGQASWSLYGPDGREYVVAHRPRYIADDLLTLKFAALSGVGACVLPDYMCADELEDGRLVRLLPDWDPAPGIVHAVFASRRGMVPAVRAFLDFLGERFKPEQHLYVPCDQVFSGQARTS